MDKISVVIPVNNETKKSVRGYDEYGTVRVARQVPRVFGHIVGFPDVRMLVASRRKRWSRTLAMKFVRRVE